MARIFGLVLAFYTALPSAACSPTPAATQDEHSLCPVPGATQACSCSLHPGVQTCMTGGWSACVCSTEGAQTIAGTNSTADLGLVATATPAASTPANAIQPSASAPTGVVFDWPETDPSANQPGDCKPGRYVGEFSCRLHIIESEGQGAFDLSGSVELTLEQTSNGELLRIRDGHYASTSAAVIPATADIVGELNCSTSRFMGRLENGVFSVALGVDIPFTQGTFSGPLHADYDKTSAAMVQGMWMMTGELDGFPGSCPDGKWSASLLP